MVNQSLIMSLFFNTLRYLFLLGTVLLVSWVLASHTWNLYNSIFQEPGGSWLDLSELVGFQLNYIFFLPLFFVLFSKRGVHWWWPIVFLYLPIVAFEYSSNFRYLTLDIALASGGFLCAWLIRLLTTHTLGKIPSLEQYKKYF